MKTFERDYFVQSNVKQIVEVNEDAFLKAIKVGWLPIPQSVVPPERVPFLWSEVPNGVESDKNDFYEELNDAVEKSLPFDCDKIGIWFSGGIDSSTLLRILVDQIGPERIVAFRLNFGYRDEEVEASRLLSDDLGVKLITSDMGMYDHIELLEETIRNKRMPTAFNTQVTFAQNLCVDNDIKIVYSALGLDEIQAGYPGHVNASDEAFPGIEKEYLWRCHSHYAWNQKYLCPKLDVRFPFLDANLIEYSRGLPRDAKCRGQETKVLLREVMKDRLPTMIVEAGRLAGIKGGFVPPISKWWKEGLGDWAIGEIKKAPKKITSSALGSWYALKNAFGKGNRWIQLRVASVPTLMRLAENDDFASQ
jgi:asparagine synthetase B (glutamine-hydrolysing)